MTNKEKIMGLPREAKDGDWTAETVIFMDDSVRGVPTETELQSEQNYSLSFITDASI